MTLRKRFVAVAMTGALAGGGLVAVTTSANAAGQGELAARSCYGNAKSYTKKEDFHLVPLPSQTPEYFTTTSDCADINIRTNSNRYVKVCFYKSNGDLNYCQDDYKYAEKDTWKVIATDVNNGVKFRFHFKITATATGEYAA
ncbi:hypothetical protein ABT147_29255 [Streptomyces sp. NPDC001868]|uniref:hypothetical protein n=1 Tax=Streptomyces sp. NPDC001868 TaxID=3154401 RepID=UPI003316542F